MKKILATIALIALASPTANADLMEFRTRQGGAFTVEGQGANVTFTWYAPVPATIKIQRHTGGPNSRNWVTIYEGPPIPSMYLQGGGRSGGGRHTIRPAVGTATNILMNVDVRGPSNVKSW